MAVFWQFQITFMLPSEKDKLATLVTFTAATGALLPVLPNVKKEWQQHRRLLSG